MRKLPSLLVLAATLAFAAPAAAAKFHVIQSLCHTTQCTAGSRPLGGLIPDHAGSLFGTAYSGGENGTGVIYQMLRTGHAWARVARHAFAPCSGDCAEGAFPTGNLVVDGQGNLYGTTSAGGPAGNAGTLFELSPDPFHEAWTYKVLHAFCITQECTDGKFPNGSLSYEGQSSGQLYDGVSPLYGTTAGGACQGNCGAAFMIEPTGEHGQWTLTSLHVFCSEENCADGFAPSSGLIVEGDTLVGTTQFGGPNGDSAGVVFELTRQSGHLWSARVRHAFCSGGESCKDGAAPIGALARDAQGNLYGTTGTTLYRLAPDDTFKVLHRFCKKVDCIDGVAPRGGLTIDGWGNLFGTTFNGGAKNGGTVFEMTPKFRILHDFCATPGCPDGENPSAQLMLDASGVLFGTASAGGEGANGGTIFRLKRN